VSRRDGSVARRWPVDPPPVEETERPIQIVRDPSQLALDALLDEDLRRLRQDVGFARAILEAMIAHEPVAVRELLASPLAHRLPRSVREEAQLFCGLSRSSLRAPMQALQHHARLAQLLVGNG